MTFFLFPGQQVRRRHRGPEPALRLPAPGQAHHMLLLRPLHGGESEEALRRAPHGRVPSRLQRLRKGGLRGQPHPLEGGNIFVFEIVHCFLTISNLCSSTSLPATSRR